MARIGNQTSCWATSPTEPFDYALARKFDAFEWFPDKKPDAGWDDTDLDGQTRRTIAEAARARGMRLSVHARWQANLLTPEGVALFWKDFELARDLGASLINIHLEHEHGLSAFLSAIQPLIQKTAEAGLQLSIENTPLHAPELFNELFAKLRALDSVPSSHVGVCLDLGHANLCAATRNDYLAFYDRLEPHLPLIHLHVHENWGDSDSHLPLFTGPSARDDSGIRGLVTRLKKRNYCGAIILEQWPHPPSLLDAARDRLLQLWQLKPPAPSQSPELKAPPPPPSGTDFVAELVEGDRTRRSWREKLDFLRDLLSRDPAVTSNQLIDVAIYLRFLGTGELACSEDGRHFRPVQHARLSSQIQDHLAKLITPDNQFIVRKIYPWLPSSAPTFQRPEPLTRIRDIAHRNDIPQDLKREIKTTLQNKLHRCVGPEDLATSAALLERITAPATSYSAGFVDQFKIFHEELKEFFNAQSLEQRLTAIAPALNGKHADLIAQFLKQKARVAAGVSPAVEPGVPPGGIGRGAASERRIHPGGETPPSTSGGTPDATGLLATFRTLTDLRRACLELVAQKPGTETEAVMLADIALEDFAFVLLSEIINASEKTDGNSAAECQINALTLALQNLVLSGVAPAESTAVQNELRAWGGALPRESRSELLRQKATMLRGRRLAEDFGDRVIALFSARADKLGRALGVAEHAIRVFCEADIRSHIVFQISKLATSLLRQIRQQLKLPPWDVLVPGLAVGRATAMGTLDSGQDTAKDPVIALLQNAVGDEEIPGNVTGIFLAHELPHLSHLAVRARQAGLVFVACEEATEFEGLQSLEGQMINLSATPDKVEWKTRPAEQPPLEAQPRSPKKLRPVRLAREPRCIPLEEAMAENSGGKAAGARRLTELSHRPDAGFSAPAALTVPFGVMEQMLGATPVIGAQYKEAIKELDRTVPADIDAVAARLRNLLQQLLVAKEILAEVQHKFSSPLIVRSSANCEDTDEFAGAGLYESVPNVLPADVGSAIGKVWSSLWTRRAVLSRQKAGIPHDRAHMAVLIQALLNPDFAFVLHTVNPVTRDPRSLYAEIVVGLGETLVSASTAGEPYRFSCDKPSGAVDILAFANFSTAARPTAVAAGVSPAVEGGVPPPGQSPPGRLPGSTSGEMPDATGISSQIIDYSQVNLSRDPAALISLAFRLCKIGVLVEQALGKPQDIEGVVIGDKVYLVQTRPQQGV
jgi:phosphoglucan,water dikinase